MNGVPSNEGEAMNDAFSGYAEVYYQREIQDPRMPLAVQAFIQELPASGWVEDWGCGPGHWSVETYKHRMLLKFRLIDVSAGMLSKAKALFPQAVFERSDVRTRTVPAASLSGIIMGYLIPYLNEVEMVDLLTKSVHALQPGGCLMMAYMSLASYKSFKQCSSDGKYKLQMNYHSSLTISELLSRSGMVCCYREGLEKQDHQDLMEIWRKQ